VSINSDLSFYQVEYLGFSWLCQFSSASCPIGHKKTVCGVDQHLVSTQ
jgi:hypothetical protein